jgi:hypothetical protein
MMVGQDASQTHSSERSRAEIEKTLRRYGASAFAYGWNETTATILFEIADRRIRFMLPLPSPKERRFTHTTTGKLRSEGLREEAYEQAVRDSWIALNLLIKAKLEAVSSKIVTVEQEFLAYIVDPATNDTVHEVIAPQLTDAYKDFPMGKQPTMLTIKTSRTK